jgi:hypothetical protein
MQIPQKHYYQAEVGYEGKYEKFTFWIIGNSPDIKGDVKGEYRRLRASRGQGWAENKYEFVDCYPIEN